MDFDILQHIPEDFNNNSRVWIYQSSRLFLMSEAFELEDQFKHFIETWNSHGTPVKGYANLFFGRFIVLMADESDNVRGAALQQQDIVFQRKLPFIQHAYLKGVKKMLTLIAYYLG